MDPEQAILTTVERLSSRGINRIALAFDRDPYSVALHAIITALCANKEITVTEAFEFEPGERNFSTTLVRMLRQKNEAVFFVSVDPGSVHAFLKQRREIAPQLSVFGTNDLDGYASDPAFRDLWKGVSYFVPAQPSQPSQQFKKLFLKRFAVSASMTASNAYDATMMIGDALKAGKRSPADISTFLHKKKFETATFGSVPFSETGGINGGLFEFREAQRRGRPDFLILLCFELSLFRPSPPSASDLLQRPYLGILGFPLRLIIRAL